MKWAIMLSSFLLLTACQPMRTGLGEIVSNNPEIAGNVTTPTNADEPYTTVACSSNSMGLTAQCHDKIYGNKPSQLIEGHIYIFKSYKELDETIMHRLVICMDKEERRTLCNSTKAVKALFKGDANRLADPTINRSDIILHVKEVIQ